VARLSRPPGPWISAQASATFTGLRNQTDNAAAANRVTVGTGRTLAINGGVSLGNTAVAGATTQLTFNGNGAFNVTPASGAAVTFKASNLPGASATSVLNLAGVVTTLGGGIVIESGSGTGVGVINLTGGTLDLGGNTIFNALNTGTLNASAGQLQNVAGINGTGGLVKTGPGTLTLAGYNTYSGPTSVASGTLLLNGTLTSSGSLSIAGGATLGGMGMAGGTALLASGAVLNPGSAFAAGRLTLGGLALAGGNQLNFRLGTPLQSDSIALTSAGGLLASGSNTIRLSLAPGASFVAPGTYSLLSYNGGGPGAGALALASTTVGGLSTQLVTTGSAVSVEVFARLTRTPDRGVFAAGEAVTYTVDVPVGGSVQWHRNGSAIAGAQSGTLVIGSLKLADQGTYEARLSAGSQTFGVAAGSLSVVAITQQPTATTLVSVGTGFALSVAGESTLPLSYQWYLNGGTLVGATSPTLSVTVADLLSLGTYTARVSAGSVGVSSNPARVRLLPLVTGTLRANGLEGQPFAYQITGNVPATAYSASGLPAGLSLNTSSGSISGTPVGGGTSNVTIGFTSPDGSPAATLLIDIFGKPLLTGTSKAAGVVGTAFNYQITATNTPTAFGASGLAPGLSVNSVTGLVSGTLATVGVYAGTLFATNAAGTGSLPFDDDGCPTAHPTAGAHRYF
jgi:autotransporter-associated beta strand protein